MTGFELAELIKERKKTAGVPIIFLTAFNNEDQHVLAGYGTGAVDYLHKPVNAAILRSKVAVFVELYRKSREWEMAINECCSAVDTQVNSSTSLCRDSGFLEPVAQLDRGRIPVSHGTMSLQWPRQVSFFVIRQDQLQATRRDMSKPPKRIRINHDDYHASFVGKTKDGRQFFITQPFVPGGNDFVASYLFDKDGAFLDAQIQDLGERGSDVLPGNALMDDDKVATIQKRMLDELGDTKLCNIKVCPFAHEWNGVNFGLITHAPEDDDDEWNVIAEPGDYMAFYPPWDGDYDT